MGTIKNLEGGTRLKISFKQRHRAILDKVQSQVGGQVVQVNDVFRLDFCGQDAVEVCRTLAPYSYLNSAKLERAAVKWAKIR